MKKNKKGFLVPGLLHSIAQATKDGISAQMPQNGMLDAVPLFGDAQVPHHGDRVYSYDYIKGKPTRCYGTLYKNEDYPDVSEWYIEYDDGQECAVLDMSLVFKA